MGVAAALRCLPLRRPLRRIPAFKWSSLSFKITDAKGKVLREGPCELKNLSFMRDASINRQDPLRPGKKLLGDWLRRDVAGKN
jgi:hypothetical protein